MPTMTDTYTQAYNCCDQVLIETERFPTIDSIRQRIGINSPTTIKRAINDWTVAFAQKHYQSQHQPGVPKGLTKSIETVWILALEEAKNVLDEATAGQQTDLATVANALKEQQSLNQKLVQTLEIREETIKKLEGEGRAIKNQLLQASEKINVFSQTLKQLQNEHERLKEAHNKEQSRWEQQREQDHDWYLKRIAEEKDLATKRMQEKVSYLEGLLREVRHRSG